MNIVEYVMKKMNLFVNGLGYDEITRNMERILDQSFPWIPCYESGEDKYGYPFRVYYDAREYRGSESGGHGIYVHMLNGVKDRNTALDAIASLLKIEGEICVSEIGDRQLSVHQFRVGVMLKGDLTAQFETDCWSDVDNRGRRYQLDTNHCNYDRKEGWMIPSESQVVGLIYNRASKSVVEKIAWNLGIDTFEFRCINDWNEEE
ncbi:MAG: hypothetical protein RBR68_15490 [Tenuifilaceae bacterium]|nr:hypothetical protein [Tenuifilaceae bacterium]